MGTTTYYWILGWLFGPPIPFTLFIILFGSTLILSDDDCEPSKGCCILHKCWDLFQQSQEALSVRDNFLFTDTNLSDKSLEKKCLTFRTFYKCINGNEGCHGDLSFHSAQKGIENQMNRFNCSPEGSVYTPTADETRRFRHQSSVCTLSGNHSHVHCGLFGDPHLRTISNEFQTCKISGAWPLLNNKYLTVMVTNDPVGVTDEEKSATSMTKITVIIKRHNRCTPSTFLTYSAQSDHLPTTFVNGRAHAGPEKSIRIKQIKQNEHVEIYLRYIDTTIVIRQIGKYLTFAAKIPKPIIIEDSNNDNLQLCVEGCPKKELIDYKKFLSESDALSHNHHSLSGTKALPMDRKTAEDICRYTNVVGFYYESCVFDLMMTGDTNFTRAALAALQDVARLTPVSAGLQQNHTSDYLMSASAYCPFHRTELYSRTVKLFLSYLIYFSINLIY